MLTPEWPPTSKYCHQVAISCPSKYTKMHIIASDFSKFPGGACPRTPPPIARLGLRPSFCCLYASWLVPRNIPAVLSAGGWNLGVTCSVTFGAVDRMTLRRGLPSASRRPLKQSLCRPWATEARNGRRGFRQERAPYVAPCEEACRVASTSCGADLAPGRAAVKWENAQCSKVGVVEGVCRRPLGRSRRWRASCSAERSRRGQYLFLYLHDLACQPCCPVYVVYVSFYPSLFSPFFFLCHFFSPASRTWRLGWQGVTS